MHDQPAKIIISSSMDPRKMPTTYYIKTYFLVLILMASSSAATITSSTATTDLAMAIEEMQKANYFTYVVLINLAPPQVFKGNLTFLMPKDKTLSSNTMTHQTSIADFLLLHSVPTPLLFEHLQRFPSGSILPTSVPGFFLNITNYGGRRGLFLNNVRIISPNICTRSSSIRCHGIDGVIQPLQLPASPGSSTSPHPPPPPPLPSHGAVANAPPRAAESPPEIGLGLNPSTTPPPSKSTHLQRSGYGPQLMIKGDFTVLKASITCLMIFLAVYLSM